jgi:uncharacterized protein (DUF924 family)
MTIPRRTHSGRAADEILHFWFEEAGRRKWFMGGPPFDAECRDRFLLHYEAASARELEHWRATPRGSLALALLLDQLSRNIFRKSPLAFASDAYAREVVREAITRRFDQVAYPGGQSFFYMPFMHSESLTDQDTCVRLFKTRMPASSSLRYAEIHRDVIARFGRFPHRNTVLGRSSTSEEIQFLQNGGFSA